MKGDQAVLLDARIKHGTNCHVVGQDMSPNGLLYIQEGYKKRGQ